MTKEKELSKKEIAFIEEIDSLHVLGFVNIKDTSDVLIYFTRRAYGKNLNGFARYGKRLPMEKPTIKDLKDFMKSYGVIGY